MLQDSHLGNFKKNVLKNKSLKIENQPISVSEGQRKKKRMLGHNLTSIFLWQITHSSNIN